MPELPEVETVRRGIEPHIKDRSIKDVIIRERRLRWPVTTGLRKRLCGHKITRVDRRGKYLLLTMPDGALIIHLGMSGRLRVLPGMRAVEKHDHVDIVFAGDQVLRYSDPRRFGCLLWVSGDPLKHKLLVGLGPEPLDKAFDGKYLFDISRQKKVSVKNFIMDSHRVVGVGNIYANEALFLAGIDPLRAAGSLTRENVTLLTSKIKNVLNAAIDAGGTTLRDFVSAEGKPGYFQQKLYVYGRGGLPCHFCGADLTETRVAGRSTVYCRKCQH